MSCPNFSVIQVEHGVYVVGISTVPKRASNLPVLSTVLGQYSERFENYSEAVDFIRRERARWIATYPPKKRARKAAAPTGVTIYPES
jgi:hypothetical protein